MPLTLATWRLALALALVAAPATVAAVDASDGTESVATDSIQGREAGGATTPIFV